MGFEGDLFLELGPGGIGLVAAEADGKTALVNVVFSRVVRVDLARAMATFTGEGFMLVLAELLNDVGVALLARLPAGVHGLARCQFGQRLAAIPAILAKGLGRQKIARDQIDGHNPDREQEDAEKLGRHLEEAAHSQVWFISSSAMSVSGAIVGQSVTAAGGEVFAWFAD
jgi:hypothetical protein